MKRAELVARVSTTGKVESILSARGGDTHKGDTAGPAPRGASTEDKAIWQLKQQFRVLLPLLVGSGLHGMELQTGSTYADKPPERQRIEETEKVGEGYRIRRGMRTVGFSNQYEHTFRGTEKRDGVECCAFTIGSRSHARSLRRGSGPEPTESAGGTEKAALVREAFYSSDDGMLHFLRYEDERQVLIPPPLLRARRDTGGAAEKEKSDSGPPPRRIFQKTILRIPVPAGTFAK
jgi:hypothetical protein